MPSNMKSAVPELRSRLGTIEQLMAALESQMALLRNEREEVLGKLAAIVYPILSIPPEVTSEIFLRYVGSPPQSPLLLASVCRSWRAIALSTCGLWTYLNSTYRTAPNLAEKLQDWLSRAGGLPVDLYIRLPPSPSAEADRILQKITENSSRWRCLDIISNGETTFLVDLHGPFSSLTQFSLWTTHFYGSTTIPSLDAPHLREVSLGGVQLINWQTSLPWNQLTTLKLISFHVDDCLNALAHTPHLEILIFYTDDEWPASPNPASSHRILPRLHTISIGSEASPAILDSLTLPSLNHLDLTVAHQQMR
ncbi:hypothetical protein C8J57DRAFT_1137539 [Mycena rebaudengoi]|nr:hypothetical protein C8J57DRAFT_1137539 [Mycena rebaudengoi]